MKIVRVKWLDITTYHEKRFLSVAQECKGTVIDIVGFLINEDDFVIRLSHMIFNVLESPEPLADDFSIIPKECILEREDYASTNS
uniref:Uncharacterized protein n=1 Tax=viral metagenome TaxID=1070528 RepID=A0A6M3LN15_9ZZZZ